MKKIFLTGLTVISFLPCSYSQDNWEVDIKDSAAYDIGFLNHWKLVKPYSLTITHDSIIVNKEYNDPILIPTDLPLNQACYYELKSTDTVYQLSVKRINYTNIEYTINGESKKQLFFSRKGIAILESTFHYGAEGVYEKSENEVYGMNDYNIELNESRQIKLLIPDGTDDVIDYIEENGESLIYLSFDKAKKTKTK